MWNNMLVSFRSHGDCGCSEQQVQTDIQFAEDDMTWVDQLPVLRINTGESFPASLCRFINSTAFIYLPAWLWSGSNVSVCFSHVGTYVWRHTHAQMSPYRHCPVSSEDVCITGHITQRINKYRGVHQIHMTWGFFFSGGEVCGRTHHQPSPETQMSQNHERGRRAWHEASPEQLLMAGSVSFVTPSSETHTQTHLVFLKSISWIRAIFKFFFLKIFILFLIFLSYKQPTYFLYL